MEGKKQVKTCRSKESEKKKRKILKSTQEMCEREKFDWKNLCEISKMKNKIKGKMPISHKPAQSSTCLTPIENANF